MRPGAVPRAGAVSVVALLLTACVGTADDSIDFVNETDQVVWVGHNPWGPDGFDVMAPSWVEVQPGARQIIFSGGCVETGEFVVARGPTELEVIDRRPIADADTATCDGIDWTWSGVGDHD